MNDLVNFICERADKGVKDMKDKFKMLDSPNSNTVLELCRFLKIDVLFENKHKHNKICVFLPDSFVKKSEVKNIDEMEKMLDESPVPKEIKSRNKKDDFVSVTQEEIESPFD